MLTTHIYFNGQCAQAIKLYEKALSAEVKTLNCEPDDHLNRIVHAEIGIHGQLIMLNDFANNNGISKSGGYQLVLQFKSEDQLKAAYSQMSTGGMIIEPPHATDFSLCVARFIDPFDVRWAFMV